jgi:TRAP-type C4-dicarboxylate transport system permease large subunit
VDAVGGQQPWTFLLLVNVFLLVLGIFLEPLPALVLTAPLFVPWPRPSASTRCTWAW